MISDAVEDGGHRVLPYTEVQVAFVGTVGEGAGFALDIGVVGGKVGGAANQLGQVGTEGTQANLGVLAGGQTAVFGGVGGEALSQPSGSSPRSMRSNRPLQRGIGAVSGEGLVPLGLEAGAALDRLTELVVGPLGHLEGAVVPVQLLTGEGGLVFARVHRARRRCRSCWGSRNRWWWSP